MRSLLVPNIKISSSILSEEGTGRLACIPCILVGVSLEVGVTSHEENTRSMQLEIDCLRRRLSHERQRGTPSNSDPSFNDGRDGNYMPKSKTPPSESFRVMRITIISVEVRVHLAKV